jgi:8-oxo-dGTP diphosphatase
MTAATTGAGAAATSAPVKLLDVAVGVVIRADGSLLLGQRPDGKPYAGWWELPGGKLEPGETVLEALARELKEEVDIDVTASTPWVTHIHAYSHATVRLFFCRVTAWTGEPRGLESQALQWVGSRHATEDEIAAARVALSDRLAALEARKAAGETPGELDVAQARAQAPEDALGLALTPAVGPLLPAALPPLRWLQVPTRYAITNMGGPSGVPAFLARLDAALASGLKLVQLREPGWVDGVDADSLFDAMQQILARTRFAGARLLVNSVHPAAWWSFSDGVHFRATDAAQALQAASVVENDDFGNQVVAPTALPAGKWRAVSVHNAEDLACARALDAECAVLGPVLETASHPGAVTLGWEGFAKLVQSAGLPVFALGGQSEATEQVAREHGAHGIAGIRGLL